MKVVKLDNSKFESSCKQLALQVQETFGPDVIIGIETGGKVVMDHMLPYFKSDIMVDSVRIQRKSSNSVKKSGFVAKIIKFTPSFGIRILRKLEMYVSEIMSGFKKPEREAHFNLSKATMNRLAKGANVLIIDDAIDTGTTMELAIAELLKLNENNTIKTAALTVTHKNPLVSPEFCLHQRTVLQFPWSLDANK